MRKMLIAGNWKMNLSVAQSSLLLHRLTEHVKIHRDLEVVLAPNLLALQPLSLQVDHRKFKLAAQNAYYKDEGAYTGEVSFTELRGVVDYAIIGHSERRIYFNESLELIRDKLAAAIRNDITPILCVGETQTERLAGETEQVLHDQVVTALSNLTSVDIKKIVIAYEPVWAISTFGNQVATPDQAKKEMDFVRRQVADLYGQTAANHVRILFGGSVDDQIAGGYLRLKGCDGVLVGGASINYQKFAGIVDSGYRILHGLSVKGDD